MNSVYTSDVTTADMSSDSPDPQGYIQSKRKKWKQFLLIKCYTAEHGRGSKRNKYPHEQRDTWEDGPCGEHLCLTFTNSLKLNRAKAQKWCKLFFFFLILQRQDQCDQSLSAHSYLIIFEPTDLYLVGILTLSVGQRTQSYAVLISVMQIGSQVEKSSCSGWKEGKTKPLADTRESYKGEIHSSSGFITLLIEQFLLQKLFLPLQV